MAKKRKEDEEVERKQEEVRRRIEEQEAKKRAEEEAIQKKKAEEEEKARKKAEKEAEYQKYLKWKQAKEQREIEAEILETKEQEERAKSNLKRKQDEFKEKEEKRKAEREKLTKETEMKKRKISRENVDDELDHSYDITLEYDDFEDDGEAKKEPEQKPKRRYRRKGEDEEGEIEGKEILISREIYVLFKEKFLAFTLVQRGKNEKFSLTEKIYRQINSSLAIYLVRTLFSRNFCLNNVRLNFHNFHTAQCGNCCDLVPHIFGKNFLKVTSLLNTVWKSTIKSDHGDFFPSNHFTKIHEFRLSQIHVLYL